MTLNGGHISSFIISFTCFKKYFWKYIERTHLCKIASMSFSKCKIGKTHQSSGYSINNCGLLNFDNYFCYKYKNQFKNINFYLVMYESHAYENLGYFIIDVKEIKDVLNEWNMS